MAPSFLENWCDLVALPISRDQVTAAFASWHYEDMAIAERHHVYLPGGDAAAKERALPCESNSHSHLLTTARLTQTRAALCGWFTEGFDTPVLQDAKALLDELARCKS
jgi:hypothetical protein